MALEAMASAVIGIGKNFVKYGGRMESRYHMGAAALNLALVLLSGSLFLTPNKLPEGMDSHHIKPIPAITSIKVVMQVTLALHIASLLLMRYKQRHSSFTLRLPLFSKLSISHKPVDDHAYFDLASDAYCTELKANNTTVTNHLYGLADSDQSNTRRQL